MKYAVEMGSGTMIYIPSFIKTGSGIQKLRGGEAQRAWWSHKPTYFFLNKESKLTYKIHGVTNVIDCLIPPGGR
jgi:hypothetical protein